MIFVLQHINTKKNYKKLSQQFNNNININIYSILTYRGLLKTTLCDNVCQLLTEGRWFLPFPPPINSNDCHYISEILLKV